MAIALILLLLITPLSSWATTCTFQELKAGIREAGVWTGGPPGRFESVGRNTLAATIQYGLLPQHTVLDIGAGSLRVGWWLLQFIEPENYYVIEPDSGMIETAVEIVGADINIYYNVDFEFPDVPFDFVVARSIWTHASKPMIAKMLSEFAEQGAKRARFLASFREAKTPEEDYLGEEWVGRSHESDEGGIIKHSMVWIRKECEKNGLWVEVKEDLHDQTWLLIGKMK